jgi:hypothetical protein
MHNQADIINNVRILEQNKIFKFIAENEDYEKNWLQHIVICPLKARRDSHC